jgi:hypothetical protein
MAILKANGFVIVGTEKRRLFAINENSKGDVYISIRTGRAFGDSSEAPVVVETRISLHPTRESSDKATAVKYHTLLSDGTIDDHVSYTYAVRDVSKNLYFPVCFTRYTKLAGEQYALRGKSLRKANLDIDFGVFDPNQSSFSTSFFVGAPSVAFSRSDCAVLTTRLFQIVIFGTCSQVPATDFANTHFIGTTSPKDITDCDEKRRVVAVMKGLTPDDCCTFRDFRQHELDLLQINRLEKFDIANGRQFNEAERLQIEGGRNLLRQRIRETLALLPDDIGKNF